MPWPRAVPLLWPSLLCRAGPLLLPALHLADVTPSPLLNKRLAELAPDGKPVFKGPRVAMAVHQSCEFTAVRCAVVVPRVVGWCSA